MLVAAFTTAAAYAFWRYVSAPPGRLALAGFYTAVAFAVFSKGPIGLLPLLAAAIWLLTEHGPRGLVRLYSPAGLVIFAAVTLSWLGPFLSAGTGSFGETVLWGDWLSWSLGAGAGTRGQFLRMALGSCRGASCCPARRTVRSRRSRGAAPCPCWSSRSS
jgi:4-amino-4-deoxy-L-arabinose transferase-like glycosyltransferase